MRSGPRWPPASSSRLSRQPIATAAPPSRIDTYRLPTTGRSALPSASEHRFFIEVPMQKRFAGLRPRVALAVALVTLALASSAAPIAQSKGTAPKVTSPKEQFGHD